MKPKKKCDHEVLGKCYFPGEIGDKSCNVNAPYCGLLEILEEDTGGWPKTGDCGGGDDNELEPHTYYDREKIGI